MPNIKSAMKRVKVIEKKTAANKVKKSELRTAIKRTKAAVAASADNAADLVKDTQARLDKASAKGYLHKNNVARKMSKLAKSIKQAAK